MKFFNNDIYSEAGSPIKIIYSPIVNKDGTVTLEPSGKENIQDYINSFSDECDINMIIERFMHGETDVLSKKIGQYGDFTQFPSTYAEALQLQINSRNMFDSLPADVRAKFNNDANQFFVQSGSDDWFSKLGIEQEVKKENEVDKNEQEQ